MSRSSSSQSVRSDPASFEQSIPMAQMPQAHQNAAVLEDSPLTQPSSFPKPSPFEDSKTERLSTPNSPVSRRFQALAHKFVASVQPLLRAWKLTLVNHVVTRRWPTDETEATKVAISKSRVQAAVRSSIHVFPVAGALSLVTINLAQYYVGGELAGTVGQDDQKLGALQFAAKLHELLMIASLATAIFTYIRRELVNGEGVPFGVLSAGLEIDNFSYLYSPELWSGVWAEWQKRHKKWVLITMLVCCTILGVTVGPSTANLMRPRLRDWAAGGTVFWVGAKNESLFPDFLTSSAAISHCLTLPTDNTCPHGGWETIEQQYMSYWPALQPMGSLPETIMIPSPLSSRTMVVRHRSTGFYRTSSIWQNAFTTATVQQSVIADALSETGRLWAYAAANNDLRQQFEFRKQATYIAKAPQPVTLARCEETVFEGNASTLNVAFPVLQTPPCNGELSCFIESPPMIQVDNFTGREALEVLLATGDEPVLSWVNTADVAGPTNNSIYALVAFPRTTAGDARLYTCTVDSGTAPTTSMATRNTPKVVTGFNKEMLGFGTAIYGFKRTTIDSSWASLLNPSLLDGNATVFSHLASTAGMWNATRASELYNYPFIVESILAMLVNNGMGRISYNSSITGTLKGADPSNPWSGGPWVKEILPRRGLGRGPMSAFEIDPATAANSTQLHMYATVNGYAWSYSPGKLQVAAIVTLLVYSLFAIGHLVYSLSTGWSSAAWDTTPEIIALAINSRTPDQMHNTGAGIETINPMRQKVSIRYIDSKLEYVFRGADDRGAQLKPDRPYS